MSDIERVIAERRHNPHTASPRGVAILQLLVEAKAAGHPCLVVDEFQELLELRAPELAISKPRLHQVLKTLAERKLVRRHGWVMRQGKRVIAWRLP